MRVVGSSAARVWRMTQKASECPHFGHSTRVFGSVSVISSRTRVSAGFSFPGRATRVTVASFPERERSYPHELQCTFPFAGKRSELHFGQNMRDGHAKGACDKKVARSELRVIVVLQRALDEPLNRAFLGLGAHSRGAGGRLRRFGLFVVLGLAGVRRTAMLAPLRRVCMGSTMRPGGDDLFALIVVILRVLLVQVPGSGQAISAGHTDFRGDLPEELEVVRVAAPMAGPSRRSNRHRVSVGARVDGKPRMYAIMKSLYGARNGRMLAAPSLTTIGKEATKSI